MFCSFMATSPSSSCFSDALEDCKGCANRFSRLFPAAKTFKVLILSYLTNVMCQTRLTGRDGKANRADRLLSDEIESRILFRGLAAADRVEADNRCHSNSKRTISGCEPTRSGGPQVPAPLDV